MRRVFLDTVGLIAIWDSTDQWNHAAESAMVELMESPCETVSSEQVLMECNNAAARRPYRMEVSQLRRKLTDGDKIFTPSDLELEQAWRAYDEMQSSGAGIVDQISFALMRRLGISEAFTNDEHFRAAGFVTLFRARNTSDFLPSQNY